MRGASVLHALAWLAYPPLIYAGLQFMQPRYVALLLLVFLLLRRWGDASRFVLALSRLEALIFGALLLLISATLVSNDEGLLRLYPFAVSSGMLLMFACSLHWPPSMIERFARMQTPDLPPAGVRYTRKVTQLWCVFLFLNAGVALYTALWSSREIWSLYNGFISYVLMGLLFAGEWIYRKRVRR